MAYAKVLAAGLVGVRGHLVEVEVDLANGLPLVVLSGLPDTALHEARDRVRAAIVNSGCPWPSRRITVNLLPAALPKQGTSFDMAVACAILAGAGEIPTAPLDGVVLIGELGLDGSVRPVRGVLPMVVAAARAGWRRVVVPQENAAEAALIPEITVRATDSLHRLVEFLTGRGRLLDPPEPPAAEPSDSPDLADVVGQPRGRRAVEVAAAGGHHMAMVGPPGSGKTMLAQRLPSVLPALDDQAALEVTAVWSVAGLLPQGAPLRRRPPLEAPHHTASVAALVGGGSGLARPGALSLAHRGVLFLDEAPEFSPRALEALRQPLEDGVVSLRRTYGEALFPARMQLVLAANPCPCAKPSGDTACECSPLARRRYLGRLSGPLRDRVDVQIPLDALSAAELLDDGACSEPSTLVADRVAKARAAATARWSGHGWGCNAEATGSVLRSSPWRLPTGVLSPLRRELDTGALSARGYDRVIRIPRK